MSIKTIAVSFARDRSGATSIEYGLIAGFIAISIIAAAQAIGSETNSPFQSTANELERINDQ